jgi:hypothetical protein
MTSDLRVTLLKQLCTIVPTDEEITILQQILQRPSVVSRIQSLEKTSGSAVDTITDAEPTSPDFSNSSPIQQSKPTSDINSGSEGADIESLPPPVARGPQRRLTIPPCTRETFEEVPQSRTLLNRHI